MAAEVPVADDKPEVVRWYTHARRFPILIGKAGMNGDPLPGGPYTSTQVIAWFATLAVLYLTRGTWGVFSGFTNGVLLLGIPILVGWAARWIPHDARNPVLIAAGWIRCFSAPPAGRVDGVPVRQRNPYRMRHQFVIDPRSGRERPQAAEPVRRSSPDQPPRRHRGGRRQRTGRDRGAGSTRSSGLSDVQSLLVNGR